MEEENGLQEYLGEPQNHVHQIVPQNGIVSEDNINRSGFRLHQFHSRYQISVLPPSGVIDSGI